MIILKRTIASLLALTISVGSAPLARAASPAVPAPPAPPAAEIPTDAPAAPGAAPAEDGEADDRQNPAPTPPRLSYVHGDVSFWRPGGEDWAPAQANTPLAPGDQLYTGNRGNLEIQIDSRGFVRAWGDSQLGLDNHEADFLQIKVLAGHVSLDLRAIAGGRTVELATPAAAFTIERPGYYRVDVAPDRTSFITRRGGTAIMTPARGEAGSIAASEQVVLTGGGATVETFVAPEQDVWDRWNYARTEALVDTVSARYVPPTVAGVDDLDQHGSWRVVSEYGSVWIPEGVAPDWAPYTTGRWIWDPRFGWTWVDTAPWGWAPYHYGRWVHVHGVWAWAPGPVVVRPAYAPALVAFFGAPGVRVAVGAPFVSWVALGWGEPCVPWWGRRGFVGRPWWGGWGGPRVVNNVVVNRTTVVNVTKIKTYRNVTVRNAVVAVRPDRFGRGPVGEGRIRDVDTRRLEPVRGAVNLRPDRTSFSPARGRGIRPPANVLERRVVATRAPVTRALPREPEGRGPAPQIVPAPRPGEIRTRPPLGRSRIERPRPPRAPRFDDDRRLDATPPGERRAVEPGRRPDTPGAQEPRRGPVRPGGAETPRTPDAPRSSEPRGPAAPRPPAPQRTPATPRATEPQRTPEAPRATEPRRAPAPPVTEPRRAPDAPRAPEPRRVPEPQRAPQPPRAPETRRPESPRAPDAPGPRRDGGESPRPSRRDDGDRGAPPRAERPAPQAPRPESPRPQPRVLPGEPANRLYPGPGRVERPAPGGPAPRTIERPAPRGPAPRSIERPRPAPRGPAPRTIERARRAPERGRDRGPARGGR